MKKNVVAGLGEIGYPIYQLISKNEPTIGYDVDPKLKRAISKKCENLQTLFLHVCIPFNEKFLENVENLVEKFTPEIVVIHSTISPYTTKKLQSKLAIPVIYSATRGIHKRMLKDLKHYSKFYSIYPEAPRSRFASSSFIKLMKKCKVRTKKMSNPLVLEISKIVVDTSYYGWLINYAQLSNLIAKKHGINFDEMWEFSDEIHKTLGNRPKMYPGFIGGHCVIPNLDLIGEKALFQIDQINNMYAKKIKDAKTISKKYAKGKQSHN
jgi:UDP-N-acetyl-D-mannosaminuronate dehydrogenase